MKEFTERPLGLRWVFLLMWNFYFSLFLNQRRKNPAATDVRRAKRPVETLDGGGGHMTQCAAAAGSETEGPLTGVS